MMVKMESRPMARSLTVYSAFSFFAGACHPSSLIPSSRPPHNAALSPLDAPQPAFGEPQPRAMRRTGAGKADGRVLRTHPAAV